MAWQRRCLEDIQRRAPRRAAVSWVLSSGTSLVGQVKCVALPHEAFYASAQAVNKHLRARAADRWLVAIPLYHVGGFSILVRAQLSRSQIVYLKAWSVEQFVRTIRREQITLCSLVPTQIFDLVAAGARSPESLRAIVVGGGALSEPLYQRARALGWPVLPSYGLTETASQIATASLDSLAGLSYPTMPVLAHAQVELREQRIFVRSAALGRWVAMSDGTTYTLEECARGGWLATEDVGEITSAGLRVLGRRDEIVKVLGVLVSTAQVASDVAGFAGLGCVLALPDTRAGHRLVFVTDGPATWEAIQAYNRQALGPFRIAQLCWVPKIPRGDLGKFKKAELRARLGLD